MSQGDGGPQEEATVWDGGDPARKGVGKAVPGRGSGSVGLRRGSAALGQEAGGVAGVCRGRGWGWGGGPRAPQGSDSESRGSHQGV